MIFILAVCGDFVLFGMKKKYLKNMAMWKGKYEEEEIGIGKLCCGLFVLQHTIVERDGF